MQRDVEGLPPVQFPDPSGQIPVNNLDPNGVYTLTVQLGLTGVVGSAANYGVEGDVLGGDTGFETGLGFDDVSGSGDASFGDAGSFSDGGLGGGQALGIPNNGRGTGTTAATPSLVRSLGNNFGGRLGFLYLALMFSVLALCITPRLVVPARLPGKKE
jgi:hypothetical protein